MTTDKKIIKARVGVLELAKQLGNVSEACKIMGYSRDTFYRYKELYDAAVKRRSKTSPGASQSRKTAWTLRSNRRYVISQLRTRRWDKFESATS